MAIGGLALLNTAGDINIDFVIVKSLTIIAFSD